MATCICCRGKRNPLELNRYDICKSCIKARCTTRLSFRNYGSLLEGSCNLQDKKHLKTNKVG